MGPAPCESVLADTVCTDNCPFTSCPTSSHPTSTASTTGTVPSHGNSSTAWISGSSTAGESRCGTTDPALEWNGTHIATGAICTDGTYHYTCTAFTRRLVGIVPERFSGTFQLLGGLDEGEE